MSKKLSDPTIPELSEIANNARLYVLLMDEPEGSRDRYINLSVVSAASSNTPSGNGSGNVTSHGSTTVNNIVVYATIDGTGIKDSGISRDAISIAITKANSALQSGDLVGYADKPYVNSAANIANSVAVSIGAASNDWTNTSLTTIPSVYVSHMNLTSNMAVMYAYANSKANISNSVAVTIGTAGNTFATSIGTSANDWTNTSIATVTTNTFAYANLKANIANSVAVTIGTAGNTFATAIGASSNAWTNTSLATLPAIYVSHANLSSNLANYASHANVTANVTALSVSIAQNVATLFNIATMNLDNINESSSNIHFKPSHLANLRNVMNGNGGGGLTATEAYSFSNTSANIANSVSISIGAASNGWTNTVAASINAYVNASVSGIDGTVQTINEITSNNYVLILTDKGKLVASNVIVSGANANVQIPNFGNVAFVNGTRIDVAKWGNANTRITTSNGIILNGNYHATLEFSGQYVAAGLHMQKANVWHAYGPLSRIELSDLRQINATNSSASTVRIPTDVQFGDLLLLYDFGVNGSGVPTDAYETNWIPIVSRPYSTTTRLSLSMKIAEDSDANAAITGVSGDTTNRHIIVVWRGNVPISNAYIGTLSNVASTDADQAQQLQNVVPPGIVFAAYRSSGAVAPRTFNLTSNGEHRATTSEYVKWHTANTATANAIIDMDDEGNGNFLFSGTIICR